METVGVGLVGLGTVGCGVAKILLGDPDGLAKRTGCRLELRRVVDVDLDRERPVAVPRELMSTDLDTICNDPSISAVVQVVGGIEPARSIMRRLLEADKDVVTANKALLATRGHEIFQWARERGRSVAFEASVAGGIPIIRAFQEGLVANRILRIEAIVNGTANYVLTAMTDHRRPYAEALAQAQQLGYAEADPTMDVDGTDSVHKLAILAQLAFGVVVHPDDIACKGIDDLELDDVRYAQELGYTIKLLAVGSCDEQGLEVHVSPTLVRSTRVLAQVRGPFNAVSVHGDALGHALFYGQGAGMMPTASAIVADLVDIALERARITFRSQSLWSADRPRATLKTADQIHSRYYLRFVVDDRPGVLGCIAGVLGAHDISISAVVQHEAEEHHEGGTVPLVIMTHAVVEGDVQRALSEIDLLPYVTRPTVCYRVVE